LLSIYSTTLLTTIPLSVFYTFNFQLSTPPPNHGTILNLFHNTANHYTPLNILYSQLSTPPPNHGTIINLYHNTANHYTSFHILYFQLSTPHSTTQLTTIPLSIFYTFNFLLLHETSALLSIYTTTQLTTIPSPYSILSTFYSSTKPRHYYQYIPQHS
ncbi:hypothetical protein LOTGIDRAFT_104411, partial [Lottia gigantea]